MEKRKGLTNVIVVLALLFAMVFTLLGTRATQAQTPAVRTVKVAWATDLTGPTGDTVGTQLKGGQDYFKYVNEEEGGIKGKRGVVKIDLLWIDHKSDPNIALEAYTRWRTDPNLVVATECLTNVFLAGADMWNSMKIPFVFIGGNVKVVMNPLRDYVYMPSVTRDMDIAGVVDWFLANWKEKKPPKFVNIGVDQPWSKFALFEGGGSKYAQARGVEVLKPVIIPTFPTDTTTELRKIKEAGVNFIYATCCTQTAIMLAKDAYRIGLKIPIVFDQCCQGPDIVGLLGEAGEGLYMTPPVTPFESLAEEFMTPGLKKAAAIFTKNNPGKRVADLPNYALGFRNGLVIGEVIRLALDKVSPKELNGEAIKKYGFDAMKDFTCWGLNGPMSYPPDTHVGGNHWLLIQQKGEKLYPIVNWKEGPFVTDTHMIRSPYLKPGPWKDLLGK